jgi:hypothetical protein
MTSQKKKSQPGERTPATACPRGIKLLSAVNGQYSGVSHMKKVDIS